MMALLKYSVFMILPLLASRNQVEPPVIGPSYEPACDAHNNTFVGGEQLTYKIYYNWNFIWLSAGEVVFNVEDLGDKYKLTARGRTYSSYEWFFKADDYFESIVDKSTLLPVSFKRDIKEGKYRYFEKIEFDKDGHQLKSWTGKSEETATQNVHTLNRCMRDILAMVYSIRTNDFNQIKKETLLPLNIFLDNKQYNLNLVYYGMNNDKKIHRLGRYRTHHLSPQVIAGSVFKENDRMHIWASADENQVPLMIESPVSVGSVKAVLSEFKGLKYSFHLPGNDSKN
jgi:hypothetical protein